MRRTIVFALNTLLFCSLLFNCGHSNDDVIRLFEERDSLKKMNESKTQLLNNYGETIEVLNATLDSICVQENMIFTNNSESPITKEDVKRNAETYMEQIFKIIDRNRTEVHFNSEWLSKMNFGDVIELASKCTVARMLERDDFNNRYTNHLPLSVHEFFYPLMQAYDSVEIDSDIELGGTDQRFNTLLGRDIQAAYGKKYPQLVMLLPLLEGTDGVVKMSKTYPEHCISLTDSEFDMFGKLMSIPDNMISRYFSLLTDATKEELETIDKQLAEGSVNPRDIKMKLAYTITAEYHGEEGAKRGQEAFINIVSNKGIPDDIEEVSGMNGKGILDVLVELKFVQSKGEAKRLIQGGGVKLNGEKIADMAYTLNITEDVVLQAGKRKFVKLKG